MKYELFISRLLKISMVGAVILFAASVGATSLSSVNLFQPKAAEKYIPCGIKRQIAGPVFSQAAALDGIVWEDFAKFTTGTEDSPDMETVLCDEKTGLLNQEYTQMPGWLGRGVWSAGNVAYMDEYPVLATPPADLSDNQGTFKVYFRARSKDVKGEIQVGNAPWDAAYLTNAEVIAITNEWKDYVVPLSGGTTKEVVEITGSEFFIDDIRIVCEGIQPPKILPCTEFTGETVVLNWEEMEEGTDSYIVDLYKDDISTLQPYFNKRFSDITDTSFKLESLSLDPYTHYHFKVYSVKNGEISAASPLIYIDSELETPIELSVTDYVGESFVANWKAVPEADSYVVRLYTVGDDGLIEVGDEPQKTMDASCKVEGLSDEFMYAYTVVAQKGNVASRMSEYFVVLPDHVETPEVYEATNIVSDGFTASWSRVMFGDYYTFRLNNEHTANFDNEMFTIIDTDFGNVTETGGTEEMPVYDTRPFLFEDYGEAPEWYVNLAGLADGMIIINNQYSQFYPMAFLASPILNYSTDNGCAKVTLRWKGVDCTKAFVTFGSIDANGEVICPDDAVEYEVPSEFAETTITVNGGKQDSRLLIFTKDAKSALFIDELKVEACLQSGESVCIPVRSVQLPYLTTSYDVKDLVVNSGDHYNYQVKATYDRGVASEVRHSQYSNAMYVEFPSSVSNVNESSQRVYVRDGILHIENAARENIAIYAVDGRCLFNDNNGSLNVDYALENSGIYLVKVGNDTVKVIL